MENIIFYFSGTGNSLQVASDIRKKMENCKLGKIAEYRGETIRAERIGIIFPTYMWGLPLIVRKFIEQLKTQPDTYIFAVVTYGGLPGGALDQTEALLEKKNLKLAAGFTIHMPGNYVVLYGAKSTEAQQKMFQDEATKVKQIIPVVNEKKRQPRERSKVGIDRLLTPLVYRKIKNLQTADQNFVVLDSCTGCGLCAKICPVDNIHSNNSQPVWKHQCQMCMACIQHCPKEAIQYGDKTRNRKRYVNPNVDI